MEQKRKSMMMALRNASVQSVLVFAMLLISAENINGITPLISLGYGLICFLVEFPIMYLSFMKRWDEGGILSFRRWLVPLLSFVFLFIFSVLYTSVAFGYSPRDYFISHDGRLNTAILIPHLRFVLTGVMLIFAFRALGASEEREIIVNSAIHKKPAEKDSQVILLPQTTRNGHRELDTHSFIYAESDGNYIKLYCSDGEDNVRMTIKQFEETTSGIRYMIRCHRAYVVNLSHVAYYEGNSAKGCLHFSSTRNTVPVSRSCYPEVIKALHP